jgi:3-oxoacyl-[acyl-carrier-protein] synthase II
MLDKQRRVVVTGLGAVTPIGSTVESFWNNVKEGKNGIKPITAFDTTHYKVKVAAQVDPFDMEAYFSTRELKTCDRFTQFARISAKQAMEDAQLPDTIDYSRFGVIIGSGIGGVSSIESAYQQMLDRGPTRITPYFIPMALANLAAGQVAIDHHAKGYCSCVITACAAGANAIGDAFHKIKFGLMDIMLAGGSEASITPLAIAGFMVMRALNESEDVNKASIPFDQARSGFVMGEGAGVLVLEEYEHALKRGAHIYAEIVGYGATCDAHHITAPIENGDGGAQAMIMAMQEAQVSASDVDYINAHGTSTPLNDKTETKAIKTALQDHAYKVAVSSTKSMTGHMLGAAGAVEAIISIKAIEEGFIPATINTTANDPECDLDVVPGVGRKQDVNVVLSNSLGFGGHNATLCFRKVNS